VSSRRRDSKYTNGYSRARKFRDDFPHHPAAPKPNAAAKSSAVRKFGAIRTEGRWVVIIFSLDSSIDSVIFISPGLQSARVAEIAA
jgi:hypothetical protein